MRWVPRPSMATRLRIGFALVALLIAATLGKALEALPWVLLVVTLDLAATALLASTSGSGAVRRRQAFAILIACAVAAGVAMEFGGAGALALVLVPAFNAGLHFGRRGTLSITAAAAGTGLAANWANAAMTEAHVSRVLLWSLAALVIGLLGAWSHSMEAANVDPSLAAEAGALLRRLHELADSLETGFDAPASAEMALQDLASTMRSARSAVLVGYGDNPAVPLAIRGAERTPWPNPSDEESLLWRAWHEGEATLTTWDGDLVERSVIAIPLHDNLGDRLGVLVADRPIVTPFTPEDLQLAADVARRHAANIDLSMVFASLRERAGLEERERLAREMHDGIAQEMVALGFGIDSLRHVARKAESPLADGLDAIRDDLTRLLGDLRLHIADLRMPVRPDTGLGAMIGSRLQSFGAASGITTRMHLSESAFRLPAHTEVLIYRLFLRVLADLRHSLDATGLDVRLNVAAPRVELWVSHDGTSSLTPADFQNHPLGALGGEVTVESYGERGVSVRMTMRARGAAPSATLSHERIPQPS